MILFNNIKPRGFCHRPVYSDERRRRLKAIEERARRELGMLPEDSVRPEDLRGAFAKDMRHLRRDRDGDPGGGGGRCRQTGTVMTVCLLIAMLILLWYIITGG